MRYLAFLISWALLGSALAGAPLPNDRRLPVADKAFKERRNPDQAQQALTLYRQLNQEYPDNPEIAWRFAMASQMVGHRLTKDKEEKEKIFRDGRDAALAALKLDDTCGPCHFWAGINMAQYAETVGVMKMLFSLKTVRNHLKKAAEHDPAYAHAGPYRVLGLIDQRLPGILGGSNGRAKEYFEKAIEKAPDNPLNYLFLSRLLADDMDEPKEALEVARRGLAKPTPSESEIESFEARRELELLEKKLAAAATPEPK